VERRVKAPGADLKAVPFQSAATLKPLSAYAEVLVLIVTPHWLGVETPEGQRGWIPEERLEQLP
jgi:predicted cobalt transporter CbtA